MTPERLASMPTHAVAFDTETHLIQPGLVAPPLVCASVAGASWPGQLLDKIAARTMFEHLLAPSTGAVIVGANIAYDMLVMAVDAARRGIDLLPAIFRAYDEGRVYDVQIAQALDAIAGGHLGRHPDGGHLVNDKGKVTTRYSLDTCVKLTLGRDNAKANDRWRLSYALLENTPIEEWPADARIYPVDDAVNTLEVALKQVETLRNLHDLSAQVYTAWCMHLMSSWGFCVDPEAVLALEAKTLKAREDGIGEFIAAGFYKLGADGKPKLTEKGAPSKEESLIKRLCAVAYGATSPCCVCKGSGRTFGTIKCKACEGGGYRGAGGDVIGCAPCSRCNGAGRVPNPKTTKGCDACDSTGLALDAPAIPRTDGGGISIGRDALSESGDELLMRFADYLEDEKLLTTYIPFLKTGFDP